MGLVQGNGYFIWMLKRIFDNGKTPEQLAKLAKESGLGWVAIKIADGVATFNSPSNFKGVDMLGRTISAFRDEGISVLGWQYDYGYSPDAEARVGAAQIRKYDLDAYIINAEVQYKNKPTQAKVLLNTLRRELGGNYPVGICSYRYPSYHREFPWSVFKACDFNMPQVYWASAHNAGFQLRRSFTEFMQLGYDMPFIPLGAAYTEWGWKPTVAEIKDFRNTAADMGLDAYGWWEWNEAYTRNPEFWPATTDKQVVEPLPEYIKIVMTRYRDLRIRQAPSTNAPILGYMTANVPYKIVAESGPWGRLLGTEVRWTHLAYTITI